MNDPPSLFPPKITESLIERTTKLPSSDYIKSVSTIWTCHRCIIFNWLMRVSFPNHTHSVSMRNTLGNTVGTLTPLTDWSYFSDRFWQKFQLLLPSSGTAKETTKINDSLAPPKTTTIITNNRKRLSCLCIMDNSSVSLHFNILAYLTTPLQYSICMKVSYTTPLAQKQCFYTAECLIDPISQQILIFRRNDINNQNVYLQCIQINFIQWTIHRRGYLVRHFDVSNTIKKNF